MSTAEEMAQQTGWPLEAWAATEAELGSFWWPVMQGEIAQVSGITGTSPDAIARGMTLPPDPQGRPKGAITPLAAVPSPQLDPFFDGVGRLVTACQFLELWLYFATSHLVAGYSMYNVEKNLKPKGCIKRLRTVAAALPNTDRVELLAALDDIAEIFETRHQLVHGVHGPTATPGVRIALRTDLSERHEDGQPLAIGGRLTRERMLADVDRARAARGLLQGETFRWMEILGIEDDEDDTPPPAPGS